MWGLATCMKKSAQSINATAPFNINLNSPEGNEVEAGGNYHCDTG